MVTQSKQQSDRRNCSSIFSFSQWALFLLGGHSEAALVMPPRSKVVDPRLWESPFALFLRRSLPNASGSAGQVISENYVLEYGTDCLEMHVGAAQPGEHALIIDDVVATGGTLCAAIRLLGTQSSAHIFQFID